MVEGGTAEINQGSRNTEGFVCLTKEFASVLQAMGAILSECQHDQIGVWQGYFRSRQRMGWGTMSQKARSESNYLREEW